MPEKPLPRQTRSRKSPYRNTHFRNIRGSWRFLKEDLPCLLKFTTSIWKCCPPKNSNGLSTAFRHKRTKKYRKLLRITQADFHLYIFLGFRERNFKHARETLVAVARCAVHR